jgi:hypothetical protein
MGFTDGTVAGTWMDAAGSQNAVAGNSQASRYNWNAFLQILQGTTTTGTVLAQANFTSWSTTDFKITWTTNNNVQYVIHYLLIGGATVSAQVVSFLTPAGATNDCCPTSNRPTTTTFQPSIVLGVNGGYRSNGCFPCSGIASVHAGFGLGVIDAAGNMWANGFISYGNVATKDTQRGQQATGKFIYAFNNALTVNPVAIACTTAPCLYANGFRFNYTADAFQDQSIALALQGVNFKVGSFNKCSSTGGCSNLNALTGFGFQPSAVMLTSVQAATTGAPFAGSMYGFGASDGTNQASSAITDADNASTSPVGTSTVWGVDSTTKAFTKVNNVGTSTVAPTIDAQATVAMTADGFTATWAPNDATTTEMLYIAFGPLNATSVTLMSFTAMPQPDGKTRLDWRTGYEVDNVGFRVYREQNGQRVRITPSLVPGTAFLGLGRGASSGDRTYSWSDSATPTDDGPVQYWLEDVDLRGKSTWHGPISPTEPTRPR